MKTQTNKSRFNKNTIVELNNSQMVSINGGSTTFFENWLQDQIDDAMEEMSKWI